MDIDSESLQLQELRQKNSERWDLLRSLHQEYLEVEQRRRQRRSLNNDDDNDESRHRRVPSPVLVGTLLECELQHHLQALPPPTTLPSLSGRDFALELIESYRQLADTDAVIEHRIELEKNMLQQLNLRQIQQQHIATALKDIQAEQQASSAVASAITTARDEQGPCSTETTTTVGEDDDDHKQTPSSLIRKENQWLKQELVYVSELIEARWKQEREQNEGGNHHQQSRQGQALRKHPDRDVNDHSDVSFHAATSGNALWSLDKLVLELMNQFLNSPLEPYLLIEPPTPVDPRHVEFLQSCWVIERHGDNPNLIRITDYTISDH